MDSKQAQAPKEAFFAAYGVLLLAFWLKVGFTALLCVLLLGSLPVALALAWYSEALAPFTGLVSKDLAEREKREARRQEKENYRELLTQDGGESMEWLNFLIEQMWPHIAKFAEHTIRGMEETIQKSVPVGIHFKTVSLGKEPIRFGPIIPRAVGCYYDDVYHEQGGVELQIGLSYHSDCEIILATKFASVGAACLDIQGTLSVLFRPLHNEAPFFGGMEVLFTNPPTIDLDFKGIGNLADMPGIYGTVRNIIDDAIASVMVTPNRIAKSMTDSAKVDLARLKNPAPEGVLRVKVVKAEKLAAMDFHVLGHGTSDPYVEIKVGRQQWKTPTIRKTCDPVWTTDNVHDFVVYSTEQSVFINAYDWDQMSADDALGSVMIFRHGKYERLTVKDLEEYAGKGPQPFSLHAASPKDDEPPADARLFLEIDWLWLKPLEDQELGGDGPSNYVATLKIDEIKDMPETGLGAPFTVRLSIKGTDISKESHAGWSKWSNTMTQQTLDVIRKLNSSMCSTDVIAEVVAVEEGLIKELIAYDKASIRGSESIEQKLKEDEAWMEKLTSSRTQRELTLNPQFEEVLLLTMPKKDVTAVVEVLDNPKTRAKAKKDEADVGVVARFEVKLGSDQAIEGPFKLLDPKTGAQLNDAATLEGSFSLFRLEKASKNLRLRAVGRMLGLATKSLNSDALSSSPRTLNTQLSDDVPRQRKRDRFFASIGKVFHLGGRTEDTCSEPPSENSALPVVSEVSHRESQQSGPERPRPLVEDAVLAIEGGSGKDVLFGLGMLRSARDWEHARRLYRQKFGGRDGAKVGKGKGSLVAALECELTSAEDRSRAAAMLQAHGIGAGRWPPPSRAQDAAGETEARTGAVERP